MKTLKWILFSLTGLVLLVAFFYAEEDLRGWHAWQKCKHEFTAKGIVMDWDKLIPPPVPDDQNFFAAPNMPEWFVRNPDSSGDLTKRFANPKTSTVGTTNAIVSETEARGYLAWSDQFAPDLNLLRDALKRPYARMDGDYKDPAAVPFPDFVAVRIIAQTLAQRAHCHLLLNQPEQALADLTLIHDMCHLLQAAPTGRPMTLVAAMINVAVAGLYTDTVSEGLRQHAWQEPQLVELQKQFAEVNLTPFVLEALRTEPVSTCREIEIAPRAKLIGMFDPGDRAKQTDKFRWWLWPRGWIYQNMVKIAELELKPLDGFDSAHDIITPRTFDEASRELNKFLRLKSPYKRLAAIVIPNFTRAEQTTAHNQTMVNEAQIVCALERYRLANGVYPGSLDVLAPHFIETVPHDIIGGPPSQNSGAASQPLIYRATPDGKFLLYSVGWNEKDDNGQDSPKTQNGGADYTRGDWVWRTGTEF
jgi:hypothetical protein